MEWEQGTNRKQRFQTVYLTSEMSSLRHLRFPHKCSYSRVIMVPIQIANMLITQNEIILSCKRKQDILIALLFLKRLLEFLKVAQIRQFRKSFCVYTVFKQLLK